MTLKLYYHPLASFCWKVLIPLYESATPFEGQVVDLMDEAAATAFKALWPIGRFPVLRDETRNRTVPESTTIIEYLDQHYPGRERLVPADPDEARETRFRDRFFDLYVHEPMQRIVGDRLRPAGSKDAPGVEAARTLLATSLGMVDRDMASQASETPKTTKTPKTWAMGKAFTMADCAAAPALFYADKVMPFATTHPNAAAYLQRLMRRPSFARVLAEAEPYFKYFPS